jgi:hypothetical protein
MSAGRTVCIVLAAAAIAAPAYAQTLADVARKEEARRASVKAPAKAYSNADLKRDPRDEPPPTAAPEVPAGFISKTTGKEATPEEIAANSKVATEKEGAQADEALWRRRADVMRGELESAQAAVNTLAGAANPNATAQKDALDKATAALDLAQKRWDRFETQAAVAKVPKAWLEPKQQ